MADKEISFEAALKELEKTVEKLESGECTLDESIQLFTKGIETAKLCNQRLSEAKLKITSLTGAEVPVNE